MFSVIDIYGKNVDVLHSILILKRLATRSYRMVAVNRGTSIGEGGGERSIIRLSWARK